MTEKTAGIVVLTVCCWGAAAAFTGIARFARRTEEPINFWTGIEIDPKTVTDIPAYNRENAKMWDIYSVPYYLAGLLGIFSAAACTIVLVLSCFPGLWLLTRCYRRIEKKHIRKI